MHNEVKFPVAEMEDGTGLLITRRCKNDCIIESHEFPNYEAGIMVSKALTDMGFKMEKEFAEIVNVTDQQRLMKMNLILMI